MHDKTIKLRIDVTKLDKSFFFIGEKGVYADCTLLYVEQQDQYGNNGMIVQDIPKDIYEKEKGLPEGQRRRGNILGNAKVWANQNVNLESSPGYVPGQQQPVQQQQVQQPVQQSAPKPLENLPF